MLFCKPPIHLFLSIVPCPSILYIIRPYFDTVTVTKMVSLVNMSFVRLSQGGLDLDSDSQSWDVSFENLLVYLLKYQCVSIPSLDVFSEILDILLATMGMFHPVNTWVVTRNQWLILSIYIWLFLTDKHASQKNVLI
jgi:hypothetical protein